MSRDGRASLPEEESMRSRTPTTVVAALAAALAGCGPAPETADTSPVAAPIQAGDTYVNPQPIYSGIWMPGTDGQQVELGLTKSTFNTRHTSWTSQGFHLATVTARYA